MNSEQEYMIEEGFAYLKKMKKAYQQIIEAESDEAVKEFFREKLTETEGMFKGAQLVLWALGWDIIATKSGNEYVIEEIIKN